MSVSFLGYSVGSGAFIIVLTRGDSLGYNLRSRFCAAFLLLVGLQFERSRFCAAFLLLLLSFSVYLFCHSVPFVFGR